MEKTWRWFGKYRGLPLGKGGDRVDSVFKKPVKAPKTLEKILVGVLSATP